MIKLSILSVIRQLKLYITKNIYFLKYFCIALIIAVKISLTSSLQIFSTCSLPNYIYDSRLYVCTKCPDNTIPSFDTQSCECLPGYVLKQDLEKPKIILQNTNQISYSKCEKCQDGYAPSKNKLACMKCSYELIDEKTNDCLCPEGSILYEDNKNNIKECIRCPSDYVPDTLYSTFIDQNNNYNFDLKVFDFSLFNNNIDYSYDKHTNIDLKIINNRNSNYNKLYYNSYFLNAIKYKSIKGNYNCVTCGENQNMITEIVNNKVLRSCVCKSGFTNAGSKCLLFSEVQSLITQYSPITAKSIIYRNLDTLADMNENNNNNDYTNNITKNNFLNTLVNTPISNTNTNSEATNNDSIVISSDLINYYYLDSAYNCMANNNNESCQILANLCVLQIYDENNPICKLYIAIGERKKQSSTILE